MDWIFIWIFYFILSKPLLVVFYFLCRPIGISFLSSPPPSAHTKWESLSYHLFDSRHTSDLGDTSWKTNSSLPSWFTESTWLSIYLSLISKVTVPCCCGCHRKSHAIIIVNSRLVTWDTTFLSLISIDLNSISQKQGKKNPCWWPAALFHLTRPLKQTCLLAPQKQRRYGLHNPLRPFQGSHFVVLLCKMSPLMTMIYFRHSTLLLSIAMLTRLQTLHPHLQVTPHIQCSNKHHNHSPTTASHSKFSPPDWMIISLLRAMTRLSKMSQLITLTTWLTLGVKKMSGAHGSMYFLRDLH